MPSQLMRALKAVGDDKARLPLIEAVEVSKATRMSKEEASYSRE